MKKQKLRHRQVTNYAFGRKAAKCKIFDHKDTVLVIPPK